MRERGVVFAAENWGHAAPKLVNSLPPSMKPLTFTINNDLASCQIWLHILINFNMFTNVFA